MIKAIPPATAPRLEEACYPSLKNPAVALCAQVWETIFAATVKQTKSVQTAKGCAAKAYQVAMPPLSGYENICDFIACTGYGMLLGAIKAEHGGKLLYAAQVALGAIPAREKKTAK